MLAHFEMPQKLHRTGEISQKIAYAKPNIKKDRESDGWNLREVKRCILGLGSIKLKKKFALR